MINYFGTSLTTAGHYFWKLEDKRMSLSVLYFKDIPFSPESVPMSRIRGDTEEYAMSDFTNGKCYVIIAVCGSCADDRQGCRSVFWVESNTVDFEGLKKKIMETPAAMAIINKMPFPVKYFNKL